MAARYPTVKLGDYPVLLSQALGWTLTTGTTAHMQAVPMDKEWARRALEPRGWQHSVALRMEGEHTEVVNGLYIIGSVAAPEPYMGNVLVADQRIWWNRRHVFGRFNIRRRTMERRRLDEDGALGPEIAPIVDDITYHRETLKAPGRAWKAHEVLTRVMEIVTEKQFDWVDPPSSFSQRIVDHVEIDDAGPSAVAQALELLPGADVYIGVDGRAKIFNKLRYDRVTDVLEAAVPEEWRGPFATAVNMAQQRPTAVRVLFSVLQEVRFDHDTEATITADSRWLTNVAPVPDPTLDIPASVGGKLGGTTVVRGTWLDFATLFLAWNADKGTDAEGNELDVPDLTHEVVRTLWTSPHLEALYTQLGQLTPSVTWIARIATIRAHYRQTWRIARRWMNRIFSIRPHRVSIMDTENGTFAPSVVYQGYCMVPSTKALSTELGKQFYTLNSPEGPDPDTPLSGATSCNYASVDVVDEDQGILKFNFDTDIIGNWRQIIPSRLEGVPTVHMVSGENPITLDSSRVVGGAEVGTDLEEEFSTAVIVTVAPAAPNSKLQLHSELVTPHDVRDRMPKGVSGTALSATGPIWDLRIGPQLASARYAWSHDLREDIEQTFGVGLGFLFGEGDPSGDRSKIASLICNPDELRALAESVSAALYADLADHYEGTRTIKMRPGFAPVGNIGSVTHTIDVDGTMTTSFDLVETPEKVDGLALLPASARRLFLREVQV